MAKALSRIPVELDWLVSPLGNDGYEWRARRNGQADLVFRMVSSGASYGIETYTDSSVGLRKRETKAWKSGLPKWEAFKYLHELFSAL